jgi:hypothetical protein
VGKEESSGVRNDDDKDIPLFEQVFPFFLEGCCCGGGGSNGGVGTVGNGDSFGL